jgi:hypothetical protein
MAPTSSPVVVLPAVFPRDKDVVAKLFLAYAAFVNVDLSFQSFENEVAQLPGKYAAEARGEVFLAYTTTTTSTSTSKIELADCIGCVAFRELAPVSLNYLCTHYICRRMHPFGTINKALLTWLVYLESLRTQTSLHASGSEGIGCGKASGGEKHGKGQRIGV